MPSHSGSNPCGHLLILRGATGAGKSTVAAAMLRLRPQIQIIEVDDLKRAAHGRAAICVPDLDYPKAGNLARGFLHRGIDTVVVEPLIDRWHLRSIIVGAGCRPQSRGVSIVWLECSLATAMARKRGRLDPAVVEGHHQPVMLRDRPRGEIVVDSERSTAEEIAHLLLGVFPMSSTKPDGQAAR